MRALAALALALLAAASSHAPSARAATAQVPSGLQVTGGPVLAGDRTAWVESHPDGSARVQTMTAAGTTTTIRQRAVPAVTPGCRGITSLTGGAGVLAWLEHEPDGSGGCTVALMRAPAGQTPIPIESGDNADACQPTAVAADGDTLAVTRINCPQALVTLERDGTRTPLLPPAGPMQPTDVRLAGNFVAVLALEPRQRRITVYDIAARRIAYSVDPDDLSSRRDDRRTLGWALQRDGTIAAVPDDFGPAGAPVAAWASVAAPFWHRLPARAGGIGIGLAGEVIAYHQYAPGHTVAVGLDGARRALIDRHDGWVHGGVGFDGAHIAWTNGSAVRLESWPYQAPAPPGDPGPGAGSAEQHRLSSGGGTPVWPALVADPGSGRALAAWGQLARARAATPQLHVVTRLIGSTGRPIGSARRISEEHPQGAGRTRTAEPAVAHDPKRRRFLVAWAGTGTRPERPCGTPPRGRCSVPDQEIFVRVLDGGGKPLGPMRRVTETGPLSSIGHEAFRPELAYVAATGEYLLAYSTISGTTRAGNAQSAHGELRLLRLDADGRPVGPVRRLVGETVGPAGIFDGFAPRLAVDPRDGVLLAYARGGSQGGIVTIGRHVHAQLLSGRGVPRGKPVRITERSGVLELRLAANPRTGGFLAAWAIAGMRDGRPQTTVEARPLSPTGRPAGPARTHGELMGLQLALAPEADGSGFLVGHVVAQRLDQELWVTRLARSGAARAAPVRVSASGPDRTDFNSPTGFASYGALAPAGRPGAFFAVWTANARFGATPRVFGRRIELARSTRSGAR